MAKASAPGRAKTRLIPPLTPAEAAAFNTAFLQDIAANLKTAAEQAAIAGYMAYGPPGSESFFRGALPSDIGLFEIWRPNFGDCLYEATAELLARGHASAVVLNSDSPTLPTSLLVETAQRLGAPGDRAVLGPSTDGGYYLLGLKTAHKRMFADIAWSTERVAEETCARAREIGLELHVLPTWYDVDDIAALRRLVAEVDGAEFARGLVPYRPERTAALLADFFRHANLASRLGLGSPPAPPAHRPALRPSGLSSWK